MATGFVDQNASSGIDQDPCVVVHDAIDTMPNVDDRWQIHLISCYNLLSWCLLYCSVGVCYVSRYRKPACNSTSIPQLYTWSPYHVVSIPCFRFLRLLHPLLIGPDLSLRAMARDICSAGLVRCVVLLLPNEILCWDSDFTLTWGAPPPFFSFNYLLLCVSQWTDIEFSHRQKSGRMF